MQACNSIHAAIEKLYIVSGLHIDFQKKSTGKQLNDLFGVEELQGMLKRKNYKSADSVFLVSAAL